MKAGEKALGTSMAVGKITTFNAPLLAGLGAGIGLAVDHFVWDGALRTKIMDAWEHYNIGDKLNEYPKMG